MNIDLHTFRPEAPLVADLIAQAALTDADRARIHAHATQLVTDIRTSAEPGLMEVFLAEYGLSTDEGVALMCLAEALLRVPDAATMDELIEDKIAPSDWGKHLGHSASSLVNASTWALMLTGRVLNDEQPGVTRHLRAAVKRLGEPVIRTAVGRAMREMGRQFVLGEDINAAMKRASGMQDKGYTYSYDMLGEAARTDAQARSYHLAYSRAISAIATHCTNETVAENPGISVKLSALHARYELAQKSTVMTELVPRLRSLALLAKSAGMGLNIDAEEADRLSLSLDIIDTVLEEPALAGWDGFGVVVQAYSKRCGVVIDALTDMAKRHKRRIMIRLVKGAYWDAEIKRAQVEGLPDFPVFTAKTHTDISYIANARKLLSRTDHIYPQFATHNAHTVAAVLDLANTLGCTTDDFEFQRLHGMGEALHNLVLTGKSARCRIYAPVGAHADLLAYLVRRLLENGANSSFVNQIVDEDVPAEDVAADPFDAVEPQSRLTQPLDIFQPQRPNSQGFDLTHTPTLIQIEQDRTPFVPGTPVPVSTVADDEPADAPSRLPVLNPADPNDIVGHIRPTTAEDIKTALATATPWSGVHRTKILNTIADLYEANAGQIFALLAREAGKTLPDAVAELREAVDFLRYYAAEIDPQRQARGTWVCISPWNFPLAIFTGQIAAALAAGNAVLAKPADQTPLIATFAVGLMHQAGVPKAALQLLPGDGTVGAALTAAPQIAGVAFTGSTGTARKIADNLAAHAAPGTPLIAETGGLNAMIVDSTALPEHAVRDIINGAFRSAGQRCSALRCLYVQEDIAPKLKEMLYGAMDALVIGDPWHLSTDVGPVIDQMAHAKISDHIAAAQSAGRLLHSGTSPDIGTFIAPTAIAIDSIQDLQEEIFGPVLHIATFKAEALDQVIADINATGYGLTFGLHTRIDDRVETLTTQIDSGNIYVNRDQIGAVVGSQPFGGEGLSGTGPKAGGPNYLPRFFSPVKTTAPADLIDLPGPTGESNRLHLSPRGPVLCLGPDQDAQAKAVTDLGGTPVKADPDADLATIPAAAVLWWGDAATGKRIAQTLAARPGPITPLISAWPDVAHVCHERHICIDTTAAGGNAALLAQMS